MAIISLRQLLDHAAENNYGVPAFNVNNLEQIRAIMEGANEVNSPVIVQASAGARKYAGPKFIKSMMEAAVEMNNNKRKKMWEKAWKTVIDDVAFLPLYQQTVIIATQKNVHLVPRVNEWVLAQEISIKK